MNRFILAIAAVLPCIGCATTVEDAPAEPVEDEPQRAPPKQPFVGGWNDPYANIVMTVNEVQRDYRVPIQQPPRFPDPDPNVEP